MRRIQEVIVVEGKHDTERLRKYFDCDTIETNGLSLSDETIEYIRMIQKKRGIIIFTDPDSPGNRIRNKINQEVPQCRNAFVDKKMARTDKKVGIEHASKEVLEEALNNLITWDTNEEKKLTMEDMVDLHLSGYTDSSALREKIGVQLHIGNGNAKTMLRRLNCLGISREELEEVLR